MLNLDDFSVRIIIGILIALVVIAILSIIELNNIHRKKKKNEEIYKQRVAQVKNMKKD